MECQVQKYDQRVNDSIAKQLRVLLPEIRFNISVQSDFAIIVSIRSVWGDIWNHYEVRELV